MEITATLDHPMVPVDRPFTVRLLVSAQPESPEGETRAPLNVSVVLDRSGSMGGAKIRDVKAATRMLVGRLSAGDTFSLTSFDHSVDPLVPPVRMGADDPGGILERIDSIEPRGNTFLSGGYAQGCAFARESREPGSLSRVILLTDGQANAGITDPESLGRMAANAYEDGIVTTTIGVGADFHEALLGRMAHEGGGSTYYLADPSEAGSVFREEFGDLAALAATGASVRFVPADEGLRCRSLNSCKLLGPCEYLLGDLVGGRRRSLVLELALPASSQAGVAALGEIVFRYLPAGSVAGCEETFRVPVSVERVPGERFAGRRPDRSVALEAAYLSVAAARTRSIELADRREFEEGAAVLESCVRELEALDLGDGTLDSQLESLRERARRLREEREGYFTASRRKRMYFESELAMKGRSDKLAFMLARQREREEAAGAPGFGPRGARRNPDPAGTVFPCRVEGGHVLARIGGGRALVDTGAPQSLGRDGFLEIGGRRIPLRDRYLGATIDEIGRLVGVPLDFLLGADLLADHDVMIDLRAGELSVSREPIPFAGSGLRADWPMGVPVVEAECGGRPARMVIDTGARLSYLDPSFTGGLPSAGVETDFFPGLGSFETEVREVPTRLAGRSWLFRYGTLPPALAATLSMLCVDGIIGAGLCEAGPLLFSARTGTVGLG